MAPAALPLQLCQKSCTSELRASFVVDLWQPSYHLAASRSSLAVPCMHNTSHVT